MNNQSPLFGGHNAYTSDPLLMLVVSGLSAKSKTELETHGKWVASPEVIELARMANNHVPALKTHNANGDRIDQVEFHPAWQAFMRKSKAMGLGGSLWEQGEQDKGQRHMSRAAKLFLTAEAEMGHLGPIITSNASIASLAKTPDIAKEWLPLIVSRKYDSTQKPPAQKSGVTIGLATTERHCGGDLQQMKTIAAPSGDGIWKLNGDKWFISAPMCDAFLVVAKTPKGPTCFLMPRLLPNGDNNGFQIQRLKDKLGNRSNASCVVNLVDALGQLVGVEGQGLATIAQMQNLIRADSAITSTALMRASVHEAIEHCRNRAVAGVKLIDQPLMQRVLADMALDVAASTVLSFRLAQSFDRAGANPSEQAFSRLMTPIIKYWTTKITPSVIAECLECKGINGYVEDSNLERHYREAPLNGLWEGAGNQLCLDVLDIISKSPETLDAVLTSLERDLGGQAASKTVDVIRTAYSMALDDKGSARILTEQLALTAAAAELKRIGLTELADSFIETRLGGLWRSTYGMLDTRQNASSIINALYPKA